jgi:hypothetical protein
MRYYLLLNIKKGEWKLCLIIDITLDSYHFHIRKESFHKNFIIKKLDTNIMEFLAPPLSKSRMMDENQFEIS